jgi:hypothetical protein
MLSLASDADIPPALAEGEACSVVPAAGEDGGVGILGFHVANPAGLGRTVGGGPGGVADAGFSNAAILSRREPTFGFGGVDIAQRSLVVVVVVGHVLKPWIDCVFPRSSYQILNCHWGEIIRIFNFVKIYGWAI